MKFFKNVNIKKTICIIFGIIIMIILLILLINSYNYYKEQKAFIEHCKESCFKDIYYYMTQEDSKIYFGYYEISFGIEKVYLKSNFYNEYIINREYILAYLKNLNWYEIILINNENITSIIPNVRENYIIYIENQEENYTLKLLENITIDDIKDYMTHVLRIYIENSTLDSLKKTIALSDVFLRDIIENIEWHLYIRTVEFQQHVFSTLIDILQNKIENITILSDKNMFTSEHLQAWYSLLKNTLLIATFTTTFIRLKNTYLIFSAIRDPKNVPYIIRNILYITKLYLLRKDMMKDIFKTFFENL